MGKAPAVRREGFLVAGLMVLAAAVRFAYLLESSGNPTFLQPIVDSRTYHTLAADLVGKGVFTEVFLWQPVFYPLFLAGIYSLVGPSIVVAKIVQALLGCLTCLLTYVLGRRLFGRTVGLVAACIIALYGPLIFFELELLATGWATLWSVVLLLLLIGVSKRPTWGACLALGLAGALSVLTRTTFVPFLLAGFVWLLWRLRESPRRWPWVMARGAVVLAGALAVITPVAIFNLSRTGHAGILPPSGGINLYIGNNPDFHRTVTLRPGWEWRKLRSRPQEHGWGADMWSGQGFFLREVGRYARRQPGSFAGGLGEKNLQLLGSREIPRSVDVYVFRKWSGLLRVLVWKWNGFGFPFGVLLPLAFMGLALSWRHVPIPMKLLLLIYGGSVVLVFVAARYRLVLMPCLAVLAAQGIIALRESIRGGEWRRLGAALGGALILFLLATLPGPFAQEKNDFEAEIHHGVGYNHYLAGGWEEAEHNLRLALSRKSDLMEAHHYLGLVHARRGRYAEAAQEFEEALRLDPTFSEARRNLELAKRLAGGEDPP
jgi:4-amino-4-deoxy-L-arabinose transferase-like glycosyltransferase